MKLQSFNRKREIFVITTLLLICIILWFIRSLFESNLYINSLNVKKINQSIQFYKRANNILNQKLLSKESYHYIAQQAQKEGFIHAMIIFIESH